VVLADQRLRISSDSLGDATDMSPGIEVTATSRIIITFDRSDDRSRDASPIADVGHGHADIKPGRREDFPDAHIAPPVPQGTACHPTHGADGDGLSVTLRPLLNPRAKGLVRKRLADGCGQPPAVGAVRVDVGVVDGDLDAYS